MSEGGLRGGELWVWQGYLEFPLQRLIIVLAGGAKKENSSETLFGVGSGLAWGGFEKVSPPLRAVTSCPSVEPGNCIWRHFIEKCVRDGRVSFSSN